MSPILFNTNLEWVLRKAKLRTKGILTREKSELIQVVKRLQMTAEEEGLQINENKTKYLQSTPRQAKVNSDLKVDMRNGRVFIFESVNFFNYLVVLVTADNKEKTEIKSRISRGSRSMGLLHNFLCSKKVSRSAKLKTYKTVIRPTFIQGVNCGQ